MVVLWLVNGEQVKEMEYDRVRIVLKDGQAIEFRKGCDRCYWDREYLVCSDFADNFRLEVIRSKFLKVELYKGDKVAKVIEGGR